MGEWPLGPGIAASPLRVLPPRLNLVQGEVHLWAVRMSVAGQTVPYGFESMLSEPERSRARRFVFDRDQRRYIDAQGVLRTLLGRYLGRAPEALAFDSNTYGKPHLTEDPGLHFNLSHGGDMLFIGVTRVASIGVDIEPVRSLTHRDELVRHFFTAEEREVMAKAPSEHRDTLFCRIWTAKEATLKAIGTGLSTTLDSFTVIVADGPDGRGIIRGLPGPWTLMLTEPAPGYQGALAAAAKDVIVGFGALTL